MAVPKNNGYNAAICVPDKFYVTIDMDDDILEVLTEDELARLDRKLIVVAELAAKLAANMLKGTLKYQSDGHTVYEWFEHGIDDAVDALNYFALAQLAYHKEVKRKNMFDEGGK